MKRLSFFLAVCLMLTLSIPVAAADIFYYENKEFEFSITVPGLSNGEITVEEQDSGASFYHTASRELYGGLIGSIEVVSPRSKYFSGNYNTAAYQILAMGADTVYLWKSPGGGVNSGGELIDSFTEAASALSVDNLKKGLMISEADVLPTVYAERHVPYLTAENGSIRPDDALTRGELAQMLYALLDADNKDAVLQEPFPDVVGKAEQAVAYLASYGIVFGYSDGMFRPDRAVTRAEFAVLLHRIQFAPTVGQYGEMTGFTDVPTGYWAEDYIESASVLGWMNGYADGTFHPDKAITRAEAVTTINRMLGRDESDTSTADSTNPFSDLTASHWAYGNLLEAVGVLTADQVTAFPVKSVSLPDGASTAYFVSETIGWSTSALELFRTEDGGKTWNSALTSEDIQAILFRQGQFPDEKSALASIVSLELRPASQSAVYLTVRYRPYESIYVVPFEAVRQITLTASDFQVQESGQLLAETSDGKIQIVSSAQPLNGIYHGLQVSINGVSRRYEWENLASETFAPQVFQVDITGNGIPEVVVFLTVAEGTGVMRQEIHILDAEQGDEYPVEPVADALSRDVQVGSDEQQYFLTMGGQTYAILKSELSSASSNLFVQPLLSENVTFLLRGSTVIATVPVQVSPTEFVGNIELIFYYKEGRFTAGTSAFSVG